MATPLLSPVSTQPELACGRGGLARKRRLLRRFRACGAGFLYEKRIRKSLRRYASERLDQQPERKPAKHSMLTLGN